MRDVAGEAQCRNGGEGIDEGSTRIGDDQHIAFVNCLEPANAGTIEGEAVFKQVLGKHMYGYTEMLPCSGEICEFEVYDLDSAIFREFKDFLWGRHLSSSPLNVVSWRRCRKWWRALPVGFDRLWRINFAP